MPDICVLAIKPCHPIPARAGPSWWQSLSPLRRCGWWLWQPQPAPGHALPAAAQCAAASPSVPPGELSCQRFSGHIEKRSPSAGKELKSDKGEAVSFPVQNSLKSPVKSRIQLTYWSFIRLYRATVPALDPARGVKKSAKHLDTPSRLNSSATPQWKDHVPKDRTWGGYWVRKDYHVLYHLPSHIHIIDDLHRCSPKQRAQLEGVISVGDAVG